MNKDLKGGTFTYLLAILGLTIIFSMFNPLGATMLTRALSFSGGHSRGVVEFMPTFKLYIDKVLPINISYIFFLITSLLAIRYSRKVGLTGILVLLVFTIMSFTAVRFTIFYMGASAPILGRILLCLKDEKIISRFSDSVRKRENFLYVTLTVLGIALLINEIPSLTKQKFAENTKYFVPSGAADFLSQTDIRGNMFNEYGYGGYLIWRLYPEKYVFMDGRVLETRLLEEYNIVASVSSDQNTSWEDLIKKYNITYIVMPPLLPFGDMIPLVERLFYLDDWTLIYHDHLSLIFLKNNMENIHVLNEHAKKKSEGLNTIIVQASARAMQNKNNPRYFITLGKVFYQLERYADARKAFIMASQITPDNIVIRQWLERIDRMSK
jgi:hypothetical protein